MTQNVYKHAEISETIIGSFYEVYNQLGFGFLESVYERAMIIEMETRGLQVRSQVSMKIRYKNHEVGQYKCDLVVNDVIILELKSCQSIDPSHEAQLLNYLKATDLEVGLLLNFGRKAQIKRMALDNLR